MKDKNILHLIPKITRADDTSVNQIENELGAENNAVREQIANIELDKEEVKVPNEPQKELEDKVLQANPLTK